MTEYIGSPVSVSLAFDHKKQKVFPRWVVWDGRLYAVNQVDIHRTFRHGRTLFHIFSVSAKNLNFKLILNTDSLHWRLEKVSDGMTEQKIS